MPNDEQVYAERLSAAVEEICRKQVELGFDVINDGEFGKASFGAIDYGSWASYAWARLSGWEPGEPGRLPALAGRRDQARFAEFYAELNATSFRLSSSLGGRPPVFTGPIAYVGHQAVRTNLTNFKAALAKVTAEEGFITTVAPGSRTGITARTRSSCTRSPGHCARSTRPSSKRGSSCSSMTPDCPTPGIWQTRNQASQNTKSFRCREAIPA